MASTTTLALSRSGDLVETLTAQSAPRTYVDTSFGGFYYQIQEPGTGAPDPEAWIPFPPPDFRVSVIPETGEFLGELFLKADRDGAKLVVLTGEAPL